MNDFTEGSFRRDHGDPQGSARLLELVYDELRQLAAQRLAIEKPGQTLQPTALVHEAYLRIVGNGAEARWDNRGHFFAAAAEAMRRILIDLARKKKSVRHGGEMRRLELNDFQNASQCPEILLSLDEALIRFAKEDPEKAELVKLRFYGGLSTPQAAQILGVSVATCERWWKYARTWLYSELREER